MRILVVTFTTLGYILSFLNKSISEYKDILKFIFALKEEMNKDEMEE